MALTNSFELDAGALLAAGLMNWAEWNPAPEHSTVRKLKGFAQLPEGWRYGEGGAIDPHVIDLALKIHEQAVESGLWHTDAFPGAGGEAMVTIYEDDDYLELTVEADGRFTIIQERANETVACTERASLAEVRAEIQLFGDTIWKRSGRFTGASMTGTNSDSTDSPSGAPEHLLESLSSPQSVSWKLDEMSVITYGGTTAETPVSHLSSGLSIPELFPPAAL